MIDNNLAMTPEPNSSLLVYDQNFNGLGETIEAFNKNYEDERITRSKGKEIFTFQVLSTSAIYKHLKVENIVEFGGRWFRIKYLEDDDSIKGLTTFTCYALWYELAEGMPTSLSIAASNLQAVATQILQPFGKWTKLVIPTALQSKSVRGVTLKENSGLYQLRYLAKQYELELTFGYEVVIENELRYVKTVVFLQQYAQSKLDFPLIVEENLRHIAKTEDSRNLVTAYKLTGKSENDEEEFTFASINNGNPYLVDTSWFNRLGVKPRIIPKAKQDDRFTVKQNMLDAARQFLDIYAKPLITYEAGAVLYSVIPDLHDSQLVIDDTYDILEWRRVSSRKLNYDDLTSSTIVFDDPRQNLMDLLNDDGDGALSYQENETARPIIRFADDVLGTNMNDTSGKYIGVLTTKKPVEQLSPDDFTWVLIEGPRGLAGPPGQQGPPGRDGVDGIAGRDGVGITATDITYYLSTSGITTPTTGWTSSVPALVKGRYLWTRTIWTYSDGQRETGYQVTYIAQDGNSGRDGLPGKDGVGITSTVITYARSTSGTSAPTSGWTSSVPTVPPGEFLWTKTIWNYSDNTNETGYSVAKMGNTGPKGDKGDPGQDGLPGAAGVGIRSTVSTYGLSASETTQPASWSANVPTLVKGQYLWTKNVWTYTDGRTETGYTKTYIPRDGNNGTNGIAGKDGVGIRSTSVTYASSLSGTTAPSSGWSANVPNVIPGQYLWTKSVWTYTDNTSETGYSVARMGADGRNGANGRDGTNGLPAYIHFAFSDNPNGVPFSHTDTGQRYQGYYSDNTQAHSGDANRYTWNDRWAKITETTGNLLLRSNEIWSSTAYRAKEYEIAEPLEEGKTYTFVIHWWRGSGVSSNYVPMIYYNGSALMVASPTGTTSWQEAPTQIKYDSEIDSWVVTFTVNRKSQLSSYQLAQFDNTPPKLIVYRFGSDAPNQNASGSSSAETNASFATLVKGNIPMSKWQPHWSELQNQINSKADQALTQQQINLLLEKNTLMQAELEAKLSMERFSDLEKAYLAYVDENNANVQKSEEDLIEAVRRIGEAEEVLGGLAKTKRFIDTYIKETNEGIVIGTQDNVSQIRVSHNRIAMYSAGKEVMYISQGVIHIDNGVFTKSLQIGRFRTEQHHTNLDMNVCRYVG